MDTFVTIGRPDHAGAGGAGGAGGTPGPGAAGGPRWRSDGFTRSLGEGFYTVLPADPVPRPQWVARSAALAEELGWSDWLLQDEALALLSGQLAPPQGSLATVYSGHQFGVWAGQLGDGRALLLGEAETAAGPLEVQLKGSGRTPYSRLGDGRAVLRSSIREFLASEALHALGIPTTRALAVVGSPLPVQRETVETAAVVTRVAPSFLRFGHFEHFAHTAGDLARLRRLVEATVARHFPESASAAQPAAALLEEVARRTARLVARWQTVGFCHGVLNTDNMSILGLTIDYGPYGFVDAFDPGHVCNHSDEGGRYAYHRQPRIAWWNLHALAAALRPVIGADAAVEVALEPFWPTYADALLDGWRAKLGLVQPHPEDAELVDALLALMARDRCDFTITWRALAGFDSAAGAPNDALRDLFVDRPAFDAWALRYRERLVAEDSDDGMRAARMRRANPKYVLRNHLAEEAIGAARAGDFAPVERLLQVLRRPYDEQPEAQPYAAFPPDWAAHLEISCSS